MSTHLLAIETSTRRGSVAIGPIAADTHSREEIAWLDAESSHDRDLVPRIDGLLGTLELELESVAGIIVGRGPGSFTGLRVAAATALGLAAGRGLETMGLPSIEATAHLLLDSREAIAVLLDARRGAFFLARYRRDEGRLRPSAICAPHLLEGGELRAAIPPGEEVWCAHSALLDPFLPTAEYPRAEVGPGGPNALALLHLGREAWRDEREGLKDCSPLYLRRSSPEEKLGKHREPPA